MSIFIETVLSGLTLGAYYAIITLGLSLIFGVVRLVNFAHGDFFMVGGFTLYLLQSIQSPPLPYPLIVVLTTLFLAAFGIAFERIVVHRIIERSWHVHLVATLASSFILSSTAFLIFSSDPKQVPTEYSKATVEILGAQTSVQRLIVLVAVVVIFLGLRWFLAHTKLGKAMRAVSQNRDQCVIVGIDIRHITVVTFALSAALAGLGAALIAPLFSVSPPMGSLITLKALAAVVLGGLGQVTGAFYASFILGITESFFAAYVPGGFAYKDVAAFAILLGVLMFRPEGLFGRKIGL
jgi:branched-chain amino acid transport system permease protein